MTVLKLRRAWLDLEPRWSRAEQAPRTPGAGCAPRCRLPPKQDFYWFEGLRVTYSQLLLMSENAIKGNTLAFRSLKLAPCCSAAPP